MKLCCTKILTFKLKYPYVIVKYKPCGIIQQGFAGDEILVVGFIETRKKQKPGSHVSTKLSTKTFYVLNECCFSFLFIFYCYHNIFLFLFFNYISSLEHF